MLFNSPIFLFVFLPAFLVAFYVVKRLWPRGILVVIGVASMLFYWNGGAYNPLVLVGSIVFNYVMALLLERAGKRTHKNLLLTIGVAAELGLLFYYKYANFFLGEIAKLTGTGFDALEVMLPLAISFFTFQQISFLVDLHSGRIRCPAFAEYFSYVSFFPQLIAGPIVRFDEIHGQFVSNAARRPSRATWSDLTIGFAIFAVGLVKKVVLADTMAEFADPVFAAAAGGGVITNPDAWVAMIAFSFQIYFDFSGYSDMAVGLARMAGFRLPINFTSPFKSLNIAEFWRHWHITLTRVVTDYLYTPVSLRMTRQAMMRRFSPSATTLYGIAAPVLLTFALLGLWHGAGWNFLVFGLMHGVYMLAYHAWAKYRKQSGVPALPSLAALALTFGAVSLSFVMFRADDVETAMHIYRALVFADGVIMPEGIAGPVAWLLGHVHAVDMQIVASTAWQGARAFAWLGLGAVVVFTLPNVYEIMRRYRPAIMREPPPMQPSIGRPATWTQLGGLGLGIAVCVLAFLQVDPLVLHAVPTTVTFALSLAALPLTAAFTGRHTVAITWRRTALWLMLGAVILSVGVIDVATDRGIEFIYFEF